MNTLKWNRDFALEQAAGDSELLGELLEIFKGSFAADLDALEKGLNEGQAAVVCAAAHSIKGSSASLGMEGIRELAGPIEAESRAGGLSEAEEKLPLLRQLLAEIRQL
jgi:HPt (histidine-containing phosphotransfer) domain-containing protein